MNNIEIALVVVPLVLIILSNITEKRNRKTLKDRIREVEGGIMNAELTALRDRVAKGNEKLHDAWAQMKTLDEGSWKQASDQYDEALEKLKRLCMELKAQYQDCLYINEQGKKTKNCLVNLNDPTWFCRVCPCASGKALWYSEQELFSEMHS